MSVVSPRQIAREHWIPGKSGNSAFTRSRKEVTHIAGVAGVAGVAGGTAPFEEQRAVTVRSTTTVAANVHDGQCATHCPGPTCRGWQPAASSRWISRGETAWRGGLAVAGASGLALPWHRRDREAQPAEQALR